LSTLLLLNIQQKASTTMSMYTSNKSKRSSGLDFSDREYELSLYQRPDVLDYYYQAGPNPSHLMRNKTERRRLQDMQKSGGVKNIPKGPYKPTTLKQRWKLWMINDGGKRLFLFVWAFLHLLVGVFGYMTYQMKDNYNNARTTFKMGFG
jgi:NADPH oxidase 2